jgi:hypothetical protein
MNWLRRPNCVLRAKLRGVTPAESDARDSTFRPFSGRSSICFSLITCPTDALCVWSSGVSPVTVTCSLTVARPSVTFGRAVSPCRSTKFGTSAAWNPWSSTLM